MVIAGSQVSPEAGTRRASAILARAQRRDVRPNIWASLRSEKRIAGLGAQPVRRHRGVIDRADLRHRLVTLAAGGDGRWPGDPGRRLPFLVRRVPLATAGEPGAGGGGHGRIGRSAAGHGVAQLPRRPPAACRPGLSDEPDQELIRAHDTDCQPGRHYHPGQTVGPALGHVRREGRCGPQAEQPPGQGRDWDPMPGRVQHHHRTGVHQPVDRGRLQPGGDPAFAVFPDDSC